MPNFCGSHFLSSSNLAMSCFASEPRAPSAMSVYLPRNSTPRTVKTLRSSVAPKTQVARCHSRHRAFFIIQHAGSCEARVNFNSKFAGLLTEPAHKLAEAYDIAAVIAHQRRQEKSRNAGAGRAEIKEAILCDWRRHGRSLLFPIRDQRIEAPRVDDGSRQDVRSGFRALLNDGRRYLARQRPPVAFAGLLLQGPRAPLPRSLRRIP